MPRGSPHDQAENNKNCISRARTGWIEDQGKVSDQRNPFAISSQCGVLLTATARWNRRTTRTATPERLITIKHATVLKGELRLPFVLSGGLPIFLHSSLTPCARQASLPCGLLPVPSTARVTRRTMLFDTSPRIVQHPALSVLESAQVSRPFATPARLSPHSCPPC